MLKLGFFIASLAHEFFHLVYSEQPYYHSCVWLEEGLAQLLSGQRSFLENDKNKYINWLYNSVLNKEIPPINFLKTHGSTYGEFCDCNTNKYNGYDISYALIHFILEKYTEEKLYQITKNFDALLDIEKNIIQEFKNTYKFKRELN